MSRSDRWDPAALRDGGTTIAIFAVPLAVIGKVAFDENDRSGTATLLALATIAAFVIGSGVSAWRQERDTPLSHALVVAMGSFAAIQAVFAVIRLASGNSVNLGRIVVSFVLTLGAGLIGGFLGSALRSRGIHASR